MLSEGQVYKLIFKNNEMNSEFLDNIAKGYSGKYKFIGSPTE